MATPSKPVLRFAIAVIAPAILVFVGAIAAVLLSLNRMADTVNTTEVTLTQKSLEAAVAATLRRMNRTAGDYAQWDDAARQLYGTPDPTFVQENFRDSTANPTFFDTAYLLEQGGTEVLGYRGGKTTSVSAVAAFGASLGEMISELPKDGRTFDARSTLTSGAFGLMVVSVAPVVPVSGDVAVPANGVRYLVLAKPFDQALVDGIAEDYVIQGLRLENTPDGGPTNVRLSGRDGQALATLSWQPHDLGTRAHEGVSPVALAMLAFVGASIALLSFAAIVVVARLDRKEAEARYAALHDSLTGLPNRAALVDALERGVVARAKGGGTIALAYLDLDRFKIVNDIHGHGIGDRVLQSFAARFREVCGDNLVARLGGDEFAVVTIGSDARREAVALGEALIGKLKEAAPVGPLNIWVGASVGVVEAGPERITVDELLRRADVAMYQAKRMGRGRVCQYDRSLDAVQLARGQVAAELAEALANHALTLQYQPVLAARSGQMVGVEALLRWSPHDEAIALETLMAIAEESGLIDELGAWTLRRACTDARAWPDIDVAVNVSPAQLRNGQFAALVEDTLNETGFAAARLVLEITEQSVVLEPEQAGKVLDDLRKLGIRLALDDFGTGYSSIGFLRRFPFAILKIDRSLVTGIDRSQQSQGLVRATVHIAHTLGLSVTAEGVETEAEAIILKAAGCHQLQGFLFGRPMFAAEIARRMTSAPAVKSA